LKEAIASKALLKARRKAIKLSAKAPRRRGRGRRRRNRVTTTLTNRAKIVPDHVEIA